MVRTCFKCHQAIIDTDIVTEDRGRIYHLDCYQRSQRIGVWIAILFLIILVLVFVPLALIG